MANYWKIETPGRVVFWELSLLAIGQQNSAELSHTTLVSSNGCRVQAAHPQPKISKVQFRRRTLNQCANLGHDGILHLL